MPSNPAPRPLPDREALVVKRFGAVAPDAPQATGDAAPAVRSEGEPTDEQQAMLRDAVVAFDLGAWQTRVADAIFYARATCRSHGYALAVHGSLRRDIDVVAVPWTDEADIDADALAQEVLDFAPPRTEGSDNGMVLRTITPTEGTA